MAISLICIGRNMRRERKRAGLTQNEMAQKLDISETHYSNLERAKRGLNIEFLIEFCAALDIPLERLLIGAVTGVRIHDEEAAIGTSEDDELIGQIAEIIHTCGPTAKQCLLDVCLKIAEVDHARN